VVEDACLGKGRVVDLSWHASSSRLKATLNLSSAGLRTPSHHPPVAAAPAGAVGAEPLAPAAETLTFEADMGFPPGFHLDVIRHRWSGQTGAKTTKGTRTWTVSRPGPVILTTKEDWPAELSPLVNALASWRDKDLVASASSPPRPLHRHRRSRKSLRSEDTSALLGLFASWRRARRPNSTRVRRPTTNDQRLAILPLPGSATNGIHSPHRLQMLGCDGSPSM